MVVGEKEETEMKQCPICGRNYSAVPATSRIDGQDICPICGVREGLAAAGITNDEVIRLVEESEIKNGRVEPL